MERGFKVTCFEIFRLGLSLEKLTYTIKLMPNLLYFFQLQLSKKIAQSTLPFRSTWPTKRFTRPTIVWSNFNKKKFCTISPWKRFTWDHAIFSTEPSDLFFIYSFSDSLLFPLLCFQLNFALLKYEQGQTVWQKKLF